MLKWLVETLTTHLPFPCPTSRQQDASNKSQARPCNLTCSIHMSFCPPSSKGAVCWAQRSDCRTAYDSGQDGQKV